MKKIFVTLTEYFQNGGQIEEGRLLFEPRGNSGNMIPTSSYLRRSIAGLDDDMIDCHLGKSTSGSSFIIIASEIFVQVECTVIYK